MTVIASQITSVSIVYSIICSGTYQRKHQSSTSLDFLRGIRRWLANSPAQRASNAENVSIMHTSSVFVVIQAPATGGQQPDARRQSSQHGRVSSDANRRTSASLESEGQSQSRTQQWAAPRRYTQPHEINALTPLSEEPDTPPSYESLGQQSAGQPPQRTGQGCDTQLRETSALSALSKGQGTPPSYDSLREHSVGETQPKTDPGVLPGAILSSALPEKPDGLPSYDSLGFARVTAEH